MTGDDLCFWGCCLTFQCPSLDSGFTLGDEPGEKRVLHFLLLTSDCDLVTPAKFDTKCLAENGAEWAFPPNPAHKTTDRMFCRQQHILKSKPAWNQVFAT